MYKHRDSNRFSSGEGRNKQYILLSVIFLIIVALIFVLVFKSCGKNQNNKSDSSELLESSSKTSETSGSDLIDPQNTELNGDIGANVKADDLYHETGKANGIDVSKWQGAIDWNSVKSSGIDFAIIRIGYRGENGIIYKDANADYNIQQAANAGILVGVYFFSTAVNAEEAKEEANWTASAVKSYKISYPVVYDSEGFLSADSRMHSISNSVRTDNALAFLNTISEHGYEGMLYAATSELEGSAYWDTERIEKSYKIWVARYTDTPYPQTPSPDYSGKYDMWQYTNRGSVAGIDGNTDLIVSYFTRSEAAPKDASAAQPPASAPSKDAGIYTAVSDSVTAKEITNLRDSASTMGNIVAVLKNGEFVTRTATGSNGWSRLEYGGQTVYAITSYLTSENNYISASSDDRDIVNGNIFTAANAEVTAKETTNLRSGPTTESDIIATLSNGEFVTQTAVSDKGWSRLLYNGQTVYAVTRLLTTEVNAVSSAPESTPSTSGIEFTDVNESVTAKVEVNLRSEPSGKDSVSVIYTLKNGEYVTRTGVSTNGWSRLIYNGQTVYAITSYLTN